MIEAPTVPAAAGCPHGAEGFMLHLLVSRSQTISHVCAVSPFSRAPNM